MANNYRLVIGNKSFPVYWNEPNGFAPIVGRNFSSMAVGNTNAHTGSGAFPWKLGGSAGWDPSESLYSREGSSLYNTSGSVTIVQDPTHLYGYYPTPAGVRGSVMRITYKEPLSSSNSPCVVQTNTLSGPTHIYVYTTAKFGSNYQIGTLSNKLFSHVSNEAGNANVKFEPYLAMFPVTPGITTGSMKIAVNFQGTRDEGLGFFSGSATKSGSNMERDQWYEIETELEINSDINTADGIFRLWVDKDLVLERTNVLYIATGSDTGIDYSLGNNDGWGSIQISPSCGSCSSLNKPFHLDFGFMCVHGPSTPSISELSRDAGSAAGGATVIVTGTDFQNGDVVVFGGTDASTTFVSPTSLSAVTPAHTTGSVDVAVRRSGVTSTTTGSFEYLPAPSIYYVQHDFEDDTIGSFTQTVYPTSSSLSVGNWGAGLAVSGSKSVKSSIVGSPLPSSSAARLSFFYTPNQPPLETNGLYQRWYILMDSASLAAFPSGTGQIKLHLGRSGTNPPSWLHIGTGREFSIDVTQIVAFSDFDTGYISGPPPSRTGFMIPPDTWVELQTHYIRSGSAGRSRLWINGKLLIDDTNVNYGTDSSVKQMEWGFGLEYSQNMTTGQTYTMYVDEAAAANGYIDPPI